jgi:hypothetical protein
MSGGSGENGSSGGIGGATGSGSGGWLSHLTRSFSPDMIVS